MFYYKYFYETLGCVSEETWVTQLLILSYDKYCETTP